MTDAKRKCALGCLAGFEAGGESAFQDYLIRSQIRCARLIETPLGRNVNMNHGVLHFRPAGQLDVELNLQSFFDARMKHGPDFRYALNEGERIGDAFGGRSSLQFQYHNEW